MRVEAATTDSFRAIIRTVSVDALPESDFTAKALLEGLPPDQDIFYRVAFEDFSAPLSGEPQIGRFRTPPRDGRPVSFVWSGDTCGGWGIDASRGGMRTYATMRRNQPDFFIHCGDNIYAECPLGAEQKLPNGEIWRNIVTEEKSRVAETLADFRGNYKYNLLDHNLRAFNAEVPLFAQWDDHEVTNDWWPGCRCGSATPTSRRSRRAAAAPSTNSCRRASSPPSAGASTASSPMVRCSTCSCSTCAAIADRTAPAARARRRRSSEPRRSPGSSANSRPHAPPGR
jgi:phosphodiesterase/alkaline phosphatase D-like protein